MNDNNPGLKLYTIDNRFILGSGALLLDDPELLVSFDTNGGGGFGPPEGRDPERVRKDVGDGLVSIEQARKSYGVAIDPDTLEIDEHTTATWRHELRSARRAKAVN